MSIARSLAGLFLGVCLSSQAWSSKPPRMVVDPLFGLKTQLAKSGLEPMAAEAKLACKALTNERWDRLLWVFAHAQTGATQYFVVGGYYVRRKSGRFESDTVGAVVAIAEGKCTLIGPAREVFDVDAADVPGDVLTQLARSAVETLAAALGGSAKLKAAMRAPGVVPPAKSSRLDEAMQYSLR